MTHEQRVALVFAELMTAVLIGLLIGIIWKPIVGAISGAVVVIWVELAVNGWCPLCNAIAKRCRRRV